MINMTKKCYELILPQYQIFSVCLLNNISLTLNKISSWFVIKLRHCHYPDAYIFSSSHVYMKLLAPWVEPTLPYNTNTEEWKMRLPNKATERLY